MSKKIRKNFSVEILIVLSVCGILAYRFHSPQAQDEKSDTTSSVTASSSVKNKRHLKKAPKRATRNEQASVAEPAIEEKIELVDLPEYPQTENIRAELEGNPHDTPDSIHEFGRQLVPHMEEALASEAYAKSFFGFLDDCGRNQQRDEVPHAIRVMCIANASRLAQKFPKSLAPSYAELRARADESIQPILAAIQL